MSIDGYRVLDRFPLVMVLAWRPHLAVAALLAAATAGLHPRTRRVAVPLGAAALAGLAPVAARVRRTRRPEPGPDDVTILSLNVLLGQADTAAIARLVERESPDLVVLPEAGADYCAKLVPLVAGLGYRGLASNGPGTADAWGVTVLAGPRAADVELRPGHEMRLAHVEVSGGLLGDSRLYAVHAATPTRGPLTAAWRRDLTVAARWGSAGGIVVGDLNATRDHRLLRAIGASAAAGTGRGLLGTYPSSVPRWLGIQIDHVLVPPGTTTTRFSVLDVPGTDHRGILARLRLRRR